MISKQFKLFSAVLAIASIAVFIYLQYQLRPEILGGFKAGTEEYFGYRYARDNELKSADQCDDEKNDPQMNINKKFIEGCGNFFEK